MRVLVTGSSGQIGTNLALRLLADGHGIARAVAWFREHRAAHADEDRPVTTEDNELGWKSYAAPVDAPDA